MYEDQEVVEMIRLEYFVNKMSLKDAARLLVSKSIEKGSTDNVSVVLIVL